MTVCRFDAFATFPWIVRYSSIWRFRQHLTQKDEAGLSLDERLLAAINRQLDARGLVLKRGTLIDASIVKSAVRPPKGDVGEVSPADPDAGFTKKTARRSLVTRPMSVWTKALI